MKIEVSANTALELKEKVLSLISLFRADAPVAVHISENDISYTEPSAKPEPIKKAPKAKAKPKAEPKVEVTSDDSDPFGNQSPEAPTGLDELFGDDTPAISAKIFSSDDVRDALKKYHDQFGPDMTKLILKKFKAARPSDLKESDFGSVIAACSKETV